MYMFTVLYSFMVNQVHVFSSEDLEIQKDLSYDTIRWLIKVKEEEFDTFQKKIYDVTAGEGKVSIEKKGRNSQPLEVLGG